MNSAINSKIKIIDDIVYKSTPLNLKWNPETIKQLCIDYYVSLVKAKIPVPNLLDLRIEDKNIEIQMKYAGEPLKWGQSIDQMYDIVLHAQNNNICIDPHWKNFTIDNNGKLWYVDITPPYGESYFKERLELTKNGRESERLINHFELFRPHNLIKHFIADIYKTNTDVYKIMKQEQVKFNKGVKVL